MELKPLQPLTHGNVLIVGGKPSNFDDELRTHPRVIMWDSQHEHWTSKELPQNVRAVFVTRFVGHAAFTNIIKEARKKHITIFNPEGTGLIVKQVRELLAITRTPTIEIEETETMTTATAPKPHIMGKLDALMQFHDPSKNIKENARFMFEKANEMGIQTTTDSLAEKISRVRRKERGEVAIIPRPGARTVTKVKQKLDVSVEILDNMIKELQDMRDYLVAVTDENRNLKARIDKFKQALDND